MGMETTTDGGLNTEPATERRRSYRMPAEGTALLWEGKTFLGKYELEDISLGGCRLAGAGVPPDPRCPSLNVHLEIANSRPFHVQARPIRSQRIGFRTQVALKFASHSMSVEDALHDELLRTLESGRSAPLAVLVALQRPRERMLATQLTKLKWQALRASTLLAVIQTIVLHEGRVGAVFVDVSEPRDAELALLEFLAHSYPEVPRVAVVDSAYEDTEIVQAVRWNTDMVIPAEPTLDVVRAVTARCSA